MLELWRIWSTQSLPLLPGPLWSRVIVPDKVLSMSQIELFDIQTECKQMIYAKLNCLKIKLFDLLTVCKQMTDV